MKYILGIDIGTSNTKAVGYTATGEVVTHANVSYSFSSEIEGHHELDPEELFRAVIDVISTAAKSAGEASLEGICFSAAMHGIIAVDEAGKPLTNMITWADLRSTAYALELKNSPAGHRIYERTGTPVHPMSPLCKLIWLKAEKNDIFTKAFRFISIKEFIFYHLFGEFLIDHSIASATGLFDIYDLTWNDEALSTAGITADRLSKPVSASYICRSFSEKYRGSLGIDPQTPFIMGASDGCLAHLGSNAVRPMEASLTIGTSGAVRVMKDKPVADPKQRIFNYLLTEDSYISGGPLNNGGNTIQWFARNILDDKDAEIDYDWFVNEAMSTEPGADGLIFLPYIYGERAPVWDADARGVFFGISGAHTRNSFMRAVMEGVAMALFGILETLEELLGPVSNIYVSGGFIRSGKWVQLVADVLGRKVFVSQSSDASAAGAAIIGMKAVGMIGELSDAATFFPVKESFEPDAANHQIHLRNYAVYDKLYDSLKDIKNTKYADSHSRPR
jgi:gluconokinase